MYPEHHRLPRVLTLASAALLGACTTLGPDYRAPEPPKPLPTAWREATVSAVAPVDLRNWWRQFDDAVLHALIERALAANTDLAATRAALREARARRRLAVAEGRPELTASAAAGRSGQPDAAARESYSLGLDAGWEADLFGGRRRAIEAADADVAEGVARLDDAHVSLVAEVAADYVELRGLQRRLAIAQANLASQDETLQLTAWRVQAGLASTVELQQARANREQTAAQIPQLQSERQAFEYALDALLGAYPGELAPTLAGPATMPAMPASVVVDLPIDTLRRRPDLRAAERRLAAATARIGVAEADLYPSLRLSGALGSEALTLAALGGPDTIARSVLATLSATLYDGGRRRAQVDVQDALRDQALADYHTTLLTALREVEVALVALQRRRERIAALQRAEVAARDAAALARQRYQGGLIDFQTVLETERTRLGVEDDLASAEAQRLGDLIQLYKAMGGGWGPSVATAGVS